MKIQVMNKLMNSNVGMKLFQFRTNDLVDNLVNAGNDVVKSVQRVAPIAAAICGVAAALMYMYSDRKADVAKGWAFRIFVGIGVIMGITSVISWMQNVATF